MTLPAHVRIKAQRILDEAAQRLLDEERESVKEAARRLGESSRKAQGLPPTITDPVAIGKIAAILDAQRLDDER